MKILMIWLLVLAELLAAQERADSPIQLYPSISEMLDREWDKGPIEKAIQGCFGQTENGRLPSGYTRFMIPELPDRELKLQRSTLHTYAIESCMLTSLGSVLQQFKGTRSWKYAHVVSDCRKQMQNQFYDPRNVACKVVVILNNFSENMETMAVVESHWKRADDEANPNYYKAAALVDLIRMISEFK